MTIYLVRHAKAGSRSDWSGDDRERPLSKAGRRQTEALTERLAALARSGETVGPLMSSPYARCLQTLEPLGERLGFPVCADERLAEGTPFEQVLDLLDEQPHGAVLCSHGDIIPDAIQALARRGLDVLAAADWRKATVWVVERDGDGRFTTATVWPPPAV